MNFNEMSSFNDFSEVDDLIVWMVFSMKMILMQMLLMMMMSERMNKLMVFSRMCVIGGMITRKK